MEVNFTGKTKINRQTIIDGAGGDPSAFDQDQDLGRQIKDLLSVVLDDHGASAGAAAEQLGISRERVYKYMNKQAGYNHLPCYLVPLFTRAFGTDLLMHLAHESGYSLVPHPDVDGALPEPVVAGTGAMQTCSMAIEAFSAVIRGAAAGREGKELVKKNVREAIAALLALDLIAQRMDSGGADQGASADISE